MKKFHARKIISNQRSHRSIGKGAGELKPITLVRELGTNTVNLEVRFWVNSQRLLFIKMTSSAAQAIKESLQRAGIKLSTVPQIKVIQRFTNNSDHIDNGDNREANLDRLN